MAISQLFSKKVSRDLRKTIDQSVSYQLFQKIFEKIIRKQITNFMDPLLSKYQCGYRRGFIAQNCLLAMLEKWKSLVDKEKAFGVLLTDLSKAFDCLLHELIIAKLNAYGFSLSALKLIQSYLSERKQKTKINQAYSSWEEILFGVPQGSILVRFYLTFFLVTFSCCAKC